MLCIYNRNVLFKKREERAEEVASMRKVVGDCHPELAVIAEPKKYDLATHTVTITDITDVDYIGATGLRLGVNNNVSVYTLCTLLQCRMQNLLKGGVQHIGWGGGGAGLGPRSTQA